MSVRCQRPRSDRPPARRHRRWEQVVLACECLAHVTDQTLRILRPARQPVRLSLSLSMKLDPIALAVPFFFLLIGLELLVARARGRRVYRFTDSFADLGCGVTQRVVLLLFEASLLAVYALLYEHGRLWTFAPGSPWPWILAIVGVDLGYYWWHRLSHEVNFLWAVHVVHHQSEDYNLAVALRQAVLSVWTIWPFHLPLALIGVPPLVFATVESFSTL